MPRPKGVRDADYNNKRTALLHRMMEQVIGREPARPSMRQLADAAGVSVPTLRHYFGDRTAVFAAMLEEYRRLGEARFRWSPGRRNPLPVQFTSMRAR